MHANIQYIVSSCAFGMHNSSTLISHTVNSVEKSQNDLNPNDIYFLMYIRYFKE